MAEESGLIVELGQWVLHEACHTLAAWRRQHGDRAPESISVNISRVELAQGERLLERVRAVLESSGLPPQSLLLEVTEREVMRDPAATRKLMQSLRNLGVRLAMDDFGTGTSSLDCLRDYPFDVIKVDRSFIRDVACNADMLAVIHATITLVENLGRTSVAEGVERRAGGGAAGVDATTRSASFPPAAAGDVILLARISSQNRSCLQRKCARGSGIRSSCGPETAGWTAVCHPHSSRLFCR